MEKKTICEVRTLQYFFSRQNIADIKLNSDKHLDREEEFTLKLELFAETPLYLANPISLVSTGVITEVKLAIMLSFSKFEYE